jgi:outer membrane receptor protein involved in Fe transport
MRIINFGRFLFVLTVFLCFNIFPSLAQNPQWSGRQTGPAVSGRLYGRMLDEVTGKGLGYASVQLVGMKFDSLSRQKQEVVVAGQLTRENGDFNFENVPLRGEYTLKINFMGYESISQKIAFGRSTNLDLGNIRMKPSTETLKEVTIVGEAASVTLALDKKVYRVDKNAIAAGGTAEDALRNVPSITVDIDGNIALRNAAPQIFVDGRPTNLSVDQIPADAIETVEVITNPSAKYDASGGNAGIINIVLKKDRRVGYNGSVRAGIDSRARYNAGLDINARQDKINVFLGGNYNNRRSLTDGETDRLNRFGNPQTEVLQVSDIVSDRIFSSLRTGLDWFINNRNTLTFSGSFNGGDFDTDDSQRITTDTLYPAGAIAGSALRSAGSERYWHNYGAQVAYKKLFPKEGKELTADFNFNSSNNGNDGAFRTIYPTFETRQQQVNRGSNQFLTLQTDFVNPLSASIKFETGLRAAIRDYSSSNENFEYNYGDDEFVRAPSFADRYRFNDQVYAAYTTLSHSFAKWGYQAGLRAESSFYTGELLDVDSSFQNNFPISLFPSLFLTYKVNEQDNIQLNYSRRVNRPSFFQLIPFPDFSDSLLLSRGNPLLRPEFTNSLELSYQNIISPKHNYLLTVYYKQSNNLIAGYQFTEYNEFLGRDAVVSSFKNANSSQAYGAEMTIKNTFGKMLEITTNFNAYNSIVDATNVEANLKIDQFTWFIKENINIKLPKSYTFQINGEYQSRTAFAVGGGGNRYGGGWHGGPSSTAQGYSIPVWFVDLSLRKDLWNRKGSVSIAMQDIFRSRRSGSFTESAFFTQENWRLRDPQLVRMNFSYRFGKFDTSLFKRKNTRSEDGMEGGF